MKTMTDGGTDVRTLDNGALLVAKSRAWNLSNMHDLTVIDHELKGRGLPGVWAR